MLKIFDSLTTTTNLWNEQTSIVPPKASQDINWYEGGTLPVKIKPGDSQETFARRGLHDHAIAAGLDETEANKFADKWTDKKTTLKHYAGGNSHPYTPTEFNNLKTKGNATFELSKHYDADILADLNSRLEENKPIVAEPSFAYTPEERTAILRQKNAGANQSAITDKPVMTMIDGKTKDGKPITAEAALSRYIERNYNQDRRVWGDKINEMASLAESNGVKVNLQLNEDGTALVGVNGVDKQKLDSLFNQALGETITGEAASLKAQQEETGQVIDIPIMAINGVINTANHATEPVRGTLEGLGVDTSATKLPNIPYQSEYGKKNGGAGEIGTEIGVGIVSAPALLKTAAGKVIAGVSGAYNVGAGAAGVDPTEKDENGKPREMGTLERGLRIVGGAGEIIGARPTFGETGTVASKTARQVQETIEAVTPDGQVIKMQVPNRGQTAEDLSHEMAMTPEQAAKVGQLKQERFVKEAERKLDEGITEAKAQGKINKLPIDQQNWLKDDSAGQKERLAFDPDNKKFKVPEAKVALQAEKDGVIKNPVRRAIYETGSSQGGDYIGADGKSWDVKEARGGANKIADAANQGSSPAENILVDCTGMSKAEIQILKSQVDAKLQAGAGEVHYIVPQP